MYPSMTPFTLHAGPGKLPECLLCERKHVSGLIPGSIPGWGPSNIAEFSPRTSSVWTKARTNDVKADNTLIMWLFYRVFWRQINVHTDKCIIWNKAEIRECLTIRIEAEIVHQFSETVSSILYTSHEMSNVFTGSLRVMCECTHSFRKITGSVNEPKPEDPGTNHGTHFPCFFQDGCVKEAYDVIVWLNITSAEDQRLLLHHCRFSPANDSHM